jgi:hypothetical protein
LPATLDVMREIDLAGNAVRETNMDAVNAELNARGYRPIFTFTHDVERLPNGDTAVLCATERSIDINGTASEYVGSTIVVLDKNLQVSWAWDAFDHLDVNRGPILGELLVPGGADQLNASTPVLPAVDWLHSNAVSWSPEDGNLVVSMRHQDWVIKIDYANGAGDGHVIWRLGQGGDFTVNSTDPDPWFSHQHNAHYIDDHTLILFDNGNTRRASDPTAHSRGQVWTLDEQTMTATLVVNADLGSYSGALGAAQRLSNGDYSFTLGTNGQPPPVRPPAHTVEVRPDGAKVYDLAANTPEYRTFRMQTLYEGVSDQLSGGAQPGALAAGGGSRGGRGGAGLFNSDAPSGVMTGSLVGLNAAIGGLGDNGLGGGLIDDRPNSDEVSNLSLFASFVTANEADGAAAGSQGGDGLEIGGGNNLTKRRVALADALTASLGNDASNCDDDVFGNLVSC